MTTFEDRQRAARRLYGEDPGFRELCDDLRDAEAAIARFQGPEYRDASRAAEFRLLRDELPDEIEDYLARNRAT